MSSTQTRSSNEAADTIELRLVPDHVIDSQKPQAQQPIVESGIEGTTNQDEPPESALFSTTAIPDGGYGWTIVAAAATLTFWTTAQINCWGVIQAALLTSTLSTTSASTTAFIGSLNLACNVVFSTASTRLSHRFGSRTVSLIGVAVMGTGLVSAGWCTESVPGLFVTIGVIAGIGSNMSYTMTNSVPVQYFSGHLGLAFGIVKAGGGIGATVMAVALEAMVRKVGIAWTFRIQGLLTIGVGLPAAWFMVDRVPIRSMKMPFVDKTMFKSTPYNASFIAGVIGVFALFVPPYYLPLFATSINLSSSTGAALVSAFNACNAIGRFIGGPLCDLIGPANTFVLTMSLNAISMLAIWPVSQTLAPLIIFAVINGMANGAFFTVFPTVVTGIFGPGRAAVAMGMAISGWTLGYLLGAPIAGFLLQAKAGTEKFAAKDVGVDVYRPAIFYAGGLALVASLFAVWARVKMEKGLKKKV